jgi:hypothetical protein
VGAVTARWPLLNTGRCQTIRIWRLDADTIEGLDAVTTCDDVALKVPSMSATRYVALAPALCLALSQAHMPAPASAQSAARPAELTAALLGLQHEFPETLHKITPELLSRQQQLVESLRIYEEGVRDEARVGQRTMQDVISATEAYFRELEILKVMAARTRNKSISDKEILRIRIETRAEALLYLQNDARRLQDRFTVGEVTRVDIELAKARELKAEIMLEALRNAAGEKGGGSVTPRGSDTKAAGAKP